MKTLLNRTSALCTCAVLCLAGPQAYALPTGAAVVSGHVTTSQPTSTQEVITQTTGKAIVNWNSFDIGTAESVKIIEPSAHSIQLDRVTSGSPTQILGSLSANGQVWLVNPDGVFFGPKSQVNAAGLIASTADIKNSNFLSGNYHFDIAGSPSASVINQGTITAAQGGLVALVAPGVVNSGTITAKYGTVALGAGQTFSVALDFYGDGLYSFAVNSAATQLAKDQNGNPLTAAVTNSGTVSGGRVYMTADAAANIVSQAINTTGIVEATAAHAENGVIVLDGGAGDMTVSGAVKASGDIQVSGSNVSFTDALVTSGRNLAVTTTGDVSLTDSIITATGNLAVDNSDVFSSNVGILSGNAVWLHQSPAGSIQNAIDAVGTTGTGGATLWLGTGTWNENLTITDANFTLSGSGASRSTVNGMITYNDAPGGTIENMTNNGIVLGKGSNNVTIANNIITPNGSNGITSSDNTGVQITNNILTQQSSSSADGVLMGWSNDLNNSNAVISGNKLQNFYLGIAVGGDNTQILNNTVSASSVTGIATWGNNVTITGNNVANISNLNTNGPSQQTIISDNTLAGLQTIDSLSAAGSNITISDNNLSDVDILVNTGSGSHNVMITGNHLNIGAIGITSGTNVTIEGNYVSNHTDAFGGAIGVTASTGINVTNNTLLNNNTPIYFSSSTGSITGNTLTGNNTAIELIYGSSNVSVTKNILNNNTTGISIINGSNDASVAQNTITGGTTGINANGDDDLTISKNTLSGMTTGMSLSSLTDSGGKGNAITGNTLKSITGDGIEATNSANLTIANNILSQIGGTGISIDPSNNAIISGNSISGGTTGISANGNDDLTISKNVVTGMTTGITLDGLTDNGGHGNSLASNIITNISADGIDASNITGTFTIVGNAIYAAANNTGIGINIAQVDTANIGDGNTSIGNSIKNFATGISATDSNSVSVQYNSILGTTVNGVFAKNISNSIGFGSNALVANGGNGYDINDSGGIVITYDTLKGNPVNGVVVQGSGNNASFYLTAVTFSGITGDGVDISNFTGNIVKFFVNEITSANGAGTGVKLTNINAPLTSFDSNDFNNFAIGVDASNNQNVQLGFCNFNNNATGIKITDTPEVGILQLFDIYGSTQNAVDLENVSSAFVADTIGGISVASGNGIFAKNVGDFAVSGNGITAASGNNGIGVDLVGVTSASISGNVQSTSNPSLQIAGFSTGVAFNNSTGSITNNSLINNATYGISLTNNSTNVTVSGNTITGSTTDIYIDGTSSMTP